jgi:adenosylhomocysteinase
MKAIDKHHFDNMKDGAVVANSGHFNIEINVESLEEMSETKRSVREFVEEYTLEDGRKIFLLAQGRLINLGAAEGHPPSVMDMSFSNQALAGEFIVENHVKLNPGVYTLPNEVDTDIASIKLNAMGMSYDTLTPEQDKYLNSWETGT